MYELYIVIHIHRYIFMYVIQFSVMYLFFGDLLMTPAEKTKEQQRQALNCTEEVKRTMSRLAASENQLPEKDKESTK